MCEIDREAVLGGRDKGWGGGGFVEVRERIVSRLGRKRVRVG